MIIDTHIHFDHHKYIDDFDTVYNRAIDNGIKGFIIPGADIRDLPRAIELSEKYKYIYFAVGIHPNDIDYFDIRLLETFISHDKCLAVGETGLDYYRLTDENRDYQKSRQKDVFVEHIELAREYNKPLIVHIRDASQDSKEILDRYSDIRGVLHCFNADTNLLSLKQNFYYGIGGVITFSNAKKLVEVLPKIPLDRLLIETDAPYLTPTPHRGERNEPAYNIFIAKKISSLLNISFEDICDITTRNSKNLFGIPT
jgi:TatD DNase family protein